MQKHNYLCVDFCGAVWVMGPLVLRQGRVTRNLKPVFIPPGNGVGEQEEDCLLAVGSYQLERVSSENSCFMKMLKQKQTSKQKMLRNMPQGISFLASSRIDWFFADKKYSALNNAKLNSCKGGF